MAVDPSSPALLLLMARGFPSLTRLDRVGQGAHALKVHASHWQPNE